MKTCVMVLFFSLITTTGWAKKVDIKTLLDAVGKQPGVLISDLQVQERVLNEEGATAALYPRLSAFARGELYNSPTNLRPMTPTEVNIQAGESIPFSKEILRYGVRLEAPLYVRQLYVLRDKIRLLTAKDKLSKQIMLVSRQASVVSINSTFAYLVNLRRAIAARLQSLEKTREDTELKVKNGRLAEAELFKIMTSINDLTQQHNDLDAAIYNAQRDLKMLTDINLDTPAKMQLVGRIEPGPLLGVQQAQKEVAVAEKEVTRRRAGYYPTLSLFGAVTGNDGRAYNTDEHIYRDYNYVGVALKIPLFDKSLSNNEQVAQVQLKKAKKHLQQVNQELVATERSLKQKLPVIDRSYQLSLETLSNSRRLLEIAAVAYDSGRTTTEEYLRYESQVLASQSSVYKAQQARWQVLAKQAVLYGTDLRGEIK